jgi:hypothetical protein
MPCILCRAAALSPTVSGADPAELQRWAVDPARVTLGDRLAVGGFAEVFVGKYEVRPGRLRRVYSDKCLT